MLRTIFEICDHFSQENYIYIFFLNCIKLPSPILAIFKFLHANCKLMLVLIFKNTPTLLMTKFFVHFLRVPLIFDVGFTARHEYFTHTFQTQMDLRGSKQNMTFLAFSPLELRTRADTGIRDHVIKHHIKCICQRCFRYFQKTGSRPMISQLQNPFRNCNTPD